VRLRNSSPSLWYHTKKVQCCTHALCFVIICQHVWHPSCTQFDNTSAPWRFCAVKNEKCAGNEYSDQTWWILCFLESSHSPGQADRQWLRMGGHFNHHRGHSSSLHWTSYTIF
jgi:hypothetical protein